MNIKQKNIYEVLRPNGRNHLYIHLHHQSRPSTQHPAADTDPSRPLSVFFCTSYIPHKQQQTQQK